MSLKDLISSLIEAVFGSKKAFISNQAMPNVASHITLANNVGNETEFVAPSNGYVCLQGQSNAVNNELSLVSNELRSSSWGVNGWGVRIFLPIGKGQSFKAASNGFAFNALTFISSIGGGLRSILQSGGALCLRLKTIFNRCSNSLARKQCLEEAIWALLKPCNLIRNLIGSLLRKGILLLRVTIVFSGWQFKQCGAVNTRIDSLSMRIPECIQAFHTLAQKGRLLESQLARQQVRAKITRFISSTQILSARLSFAQGVCHG